MELENHISYATGIVSIATRLSNVVLKCISKLRRIDKLHTEIHQTTQHPFKHTIVPQLELEQVDSNSENINVDNDSESIDSFSILNNNSSNDDDSQEILKFLHSNQEVLSLTSNSLQTGLLTYNTKREI
ncbi:hypothetical protein CEXT_121511 [Caerostris extrusa]|uniref:Uncharacterized protein n=1 Tax=Caerostris extrusa TaxID=172846 RepID=A0AAV4RK30_CAEEX|nr:hypothetical protein CEXT_121511 [Caerostris extrusa]